MRRYFPVLALFIIIFLARSTMPASAGNYFRYDEDIRGKVVDYDTGRPLQGVVVMVMWVTEHTRITIEPEEHYYDYFETLTDENGEFTIPGKGRNFFRNMPPPKISIYKSGYPIRDIRFEPNGYPPGLDITFRDGKRFVSYRKMPGDKRKDYVSHYKQTPYTKMAFVPADKYRLYAAERERDYQTLGIRPWRPGEPIRVIQKAVYPAADQPVSPQKPQ